MSDIITTTGLCKQYGKVLRVKDLDLKVPEGVVYGFLGPNGAGKTTTMKMILSLARPTAGTITVFGKPVNSKNRLAILKNVGSLIESPSYYGHLTGVENLQILCALKGVSEKDIDRVLQIVRLENQKEKKVGQYSMGMKQRLGIAQAIMENPELLVLDEPMNGLDKQGVLEIRQLLIELNRKGSTIILSSHYAEDIEALCDTVCEMDGGSITDQHELKSSLK